METTSPFAAPAPKRLVRSTDDRKVAGVCAGIARYLGVDPNVVRLAFVALTPLGCSGLVIYGAAWILVPQQESR